MLSKQRDKSMGLQAEDKNKHAWLEEWYDSCVSGSVIRDYESGNIETVYIDGAGNILLTVNPKERTLNRES